MKTETILTRLEAERENAQNELLKAKASDLKDKQELCEYWDGKASGLKFAILLIKSIID